MTIKSVLGKFAYETFRTRSGSDYSEIFTRGRGEEGKSPYPWLYARVFLCCFLLFCFVCLAYSVSELNFPEAIVTGGVLLDITFIVLLFELYPGRDMPLILPLSVFFVGGALASALSNLLYGILNVSQPYAEEAWISFNEETCKAAVTVALVVLLGKRNPFYCFIIGAAVGGGFSAYENMWFMYTDGFYYMNGLSMAMQSALWRALGTPFSHAAWAGLFGWALSFSKPWKNIRCYGVYLFNLVMHFFVDFPLMQEFAGWKGYPISAISGLLTFAFMLCVLVRLRGGKRPQGGEYVVRYPRINCEALPEEKRWSADYGILKNACGWLFLFLAGLTSLGPTCVFGGYSSYRTVEFQDWNSCLNALHGGRYIEFDPARPYEELDDISLNYSYTVQEGELFGVVQREQFGDYFVLYSYEYETSEGEDGEQMRAMELKNVKLAIDEAEYNMRVLYVDGDGYMDVEPQKYYYFDIAGYYGLYGYPDGAFYARIAERTPVRATLSVVYTAVCGAFCIGAGAAYLYFKNKQRRYENVK